MPEDFKENFSPDTQMLNDLIDSVHKEALKDPDGYGIAGSLEPDEEDDAPLDDSGSPPKKRRKKSRWLPIALCCLLLIAGIGAAVYFFIIAPSNIHIDDITLLDAGTDHLTVQVDSAEKDGSFQVVCSDTYGNKFHQSFQAKTGLTFSGLVPGTQYTVTIEPANGEKLTGNYSIMATTLAQTEILSFTRRCRLQFRARLRSSRGTLRATRRRAGLSRSQAQTITPTRRSFPRRLSPLRV